MARHYIIGRERVRLQSTIRLTADERPSVRTTNGTSEGRVGVPMRGMKTSSLAILCALVIACDARVSADTSPKEVAHDARAPIPGSASSPTNPVDMSHRDPASSTSPPDVWPTPPPGFTELCWMKPAPDLGYLNPCHLTLDLDGDGLPDRAGLVVDAKGKRGIVLELTTRSSNGAGSRTVFAGAGTTVGNGGDDFSWMGGWRVAKKDEVPGWAKGDALFVGALESASGVIAWTGEELGWVQQGD